MQSSLRSENESFSRALALVILVAGVTFFLNLGSAKLWDEDEPRNARCAVEMMQRNDWVVPTFNDELRTHKPILLYWLTITAYHCFGVSEFSARAASAMAGLATVVCLFLLTDRLFRRGVATLAALILTSSLMFVVAARAATPDAVLIFCITLALTIYVRETWVEAPDEDRDGLRLKGQFFIVRWRSWLAFYATLGLAMLAKGPVGFILPMAIIGMFLLIMDSDMSAEKPQPITRSSKWQSALGTVWFAIKSWFAPRRFMRVLASMRPIRGAFIALAIALPWYAAVGYATEGEWLKGFFLEHNLARASQSMEGHKGSMFLFYPLALCVGFFPWSVFLTPSLLEFWSARRASQRASAPMVLGLCWIFVTMLMFSMAATKLPSYITPGYPGIAMVVAVFLHRFRTGVSKVSKVWQQLAFGIGGVVGIMGIVGIVALAYAILPGDQWLAVIAVPLLVGGAVAFELNRRRLTAHALTAYLVGAGSFAFLLATVGAPIAGAHREVGLLKRVVQSIGPDGQLASCGSVRSSWVYYANHSIKIFDQWSPLTMEDYLKRSSQHYLLIEDDQFEALGDKLSKDIVVIAEIPKFPKSKAQGVYVLHAEFANPDVATPDSKSDQAIAEMGPSQQRKL